MFLSWILLYLTKFKERTVVDDDYFYIFAKYYKITKTLYYNEAYHLSITADYCNC